MFFLLVLLSAAVANPAPPCSAPEYRQFDFWIGEWNVVGPDEKPAGTNRITAVYGGCAIQEDWSGVRGMRGGSFSIYEQNQKKWHQTWVDSTGGLLQLDGEFRDGAMRMTGTSKSATGEVIDRVTWSRLAGDKLRQFWEQSNDGGKTWNVVFDGRYTRK